MYTIGIDYGTESARALLVDVSDGREVATAVYAYAHGVIDQQLPDSGKLLPPDWALQDPHDYLEALRITVPRVLRESGIPAEEVAGIAIDFTACTMMPTTRDGTPLCFLDRWRPDPHAWVKLWKHHAAQGQADRINEVARQRGETWLERYGGKISSEWFFSKALQILEEAPDLYAEAGRFIEATDWVIWQLTGVETRNACTAGYKAMVQDGIFPAREYFAALNPAFADVVDTRLSREFAALGARAGSLTGPMAAQIGLRPGIAVAVANVDAHVTAPAVKLTAPGRMVMIMGTSTCHILLGHELRAVEGMCGVAPDGIIPGFYGYEAGQSGVGDIFAWFVEHAVPAEYYDAAKAAGLDIHAYLEAEAAKQAPGESGLLALDWWNGNRSTLVNADLTGLLLGATLATRAPEIYRALIEATAYGTRTIIEAFEKSGIPIHDLVAAGGLAEKNALLVQIYADVTGKPIYFAGSSQAPALGSAMHAAVAAGIYPTIQDAAAVMGKLRDEVVQPIPAHRAVYDQLYADYTLLYDYFGRGTNEVMKRLTRMRRDRHGEA
ncbi:MAG TPA: ribulokinase [Chloroflexota bacterium]|nr:ribulokinase [Chloroflexota bacterium]